MKKLKLSTLLLAFLVLSGSALAQTVTFQGKSVHLYRTNMTVGKIAPNIRLVTPTLGTDVIGSINHKTQVIASIVSLDTPVCNTETIALNKIAKKFHNVSFYIVSKDLPFRQEKFLSNNNIKNIQLLSSFRNNKFGKRFGTLITDTQLKGLEARSLYVIGKNGKIAYKRISPEIAHAPDYKRLSNFLADYVKK